MNPQFLESEVFKWVILPMLIFIARTLDVTLGTLRNVFISKGFRNIVPFIGFVEVLIWLVSIRQVMQHLDNPVCYIGFAGGFAMGTYVGLIIDNRLALGLQVLRIIVHTDYQPLVDALQKENLGVTIMDGHGAKGPVKIIFTIVKRKDIAKVRDIVRELNPNAFYSIEDIRIANQGVFPKRKTLNSTFDYIRNAIPEPKEK
ncbi:MAG: DUF2179 domain-containing protein [Bacteroidetes bacterium]|nr:DUF2179 domain-containing protein [Bacteroidota bacterium]